jgi:hypothetical protein
LGFDDDGHLWNLPRTGAFAFHNTSCLLHDSWVTDEALGRLLFRIDATNETKYKIEIASILIVLLFLILHDDLVNK